MIFTIPETLGVDPDANLTIELMERGFPGEHPCCARIRVRELRLGKANILLTRSELQRAIGHLNIINAELAIRETPEQIALVVPSWRDVAADALREGRVMDAIKLMIESDEKLPFSIAPTANFEALEAIVVAANDLINATTHRTVGKLACALEAYQKLIGSCPG